MQILWYRLPLALKIALPMALLSLLSALSIVAITQYSQQRLLHERTDNLGNALVSRMAASAARPLVQNDALSLQAALAEFVEEPVVQRAVVFDVKQQLIAAAGDENPNSWDYSTTIHWQDSVIGRAVLSLRPNGAQSDYPQLADLLLLSMILTALSAACGLWLGHRAEAILSALTRKLSGEQIDFDYRGTDILARVLDVPPPPVLVPEPETIDSDIIVLQLYVSKNSIAQNNEANEQRALRLTETISNLYGGKAQVTRAGGITARFAISEDFEGPFRALCCAQLLQVFGENRRAGSEQNDNDPIEQTIERDQQYRIALAVMTAEDANNAWRTQVLIDRLQAACQQPSRDNCLLIDGQLQRHPAIVERCQLEETANKFWRVTALNSPYDVLLERQFATLREQISA